MGVSSLWIGKGKGQGSFERGPRGQDVVSGRAALAGFPWLSAKPDTPTPIKQNECRGHNNQNRVLGPIIL